MKPLRLAWMSALCLVAVLFPACLFSPSDRAASVPPSVEPPGDLYGVDADFLTYPLDKDRADLDRLSAAGLNVARFDVRWADLEPRRKGEWSSSLLQQLDAVLDAMGARHIRPIVVLSSTPGWARQNAGSAIRPPDNPTDFADMAGFLAARYASRPEMVYEIWNEPNQPYAWDTPSGPDPAQYTAMLKLAYARIKQAAPTAIVLGGSLAFNDPAYVQGMYRAGVAGFFDALALHPSCGTCSPEATDYAVRSFPLAVTQMEQAMADNGEPDKPIWITAMGWSSADLNHDEALRADYLRRAVELIQSWPFVKAFVVYRLSYFGGPADFDLAAAGPSDTSREDVFPLLNAQLSQFTDLGGEVVNVRDYGAQGDGSSDDTGAVSSALAAADGGTLWFPGGTYVISSVAIRAGAQVRLLGEGQGVSVLVHKAGAEASMLRGYPGTVAQLEIEQLTLDGNRANNSNRTMSLIEARVDRLLVQGVELRNSIQQAIHVRTTTYTTVIRDCWLHDFALHGPKLNEDTRAVQIDHEIDSSGDIWFINNVVEMTTPPSGAGNSAGGIRSSGDFNTRLFILDNVFKNMGQDMPSVNEYIAPIDIYRNGDGSLIQGNQIYNSYYDPIRVMRSNNYQVIGNTIDGEAEINRDGAAGIRSEGRSPSVPMHNIVIRGNTIRNLPNLAGIRGAYDPKAEASDISISGNYIEKTKIGVYLSYVLGKVTVDHNVIKGLVGKDFGTAGLRIVNNNTRERTDLVVLDNIFRDLGAARQIFIDDGEMRQVFVAVVHNYFENSADGGVTARYTPAVNLIGNVWRGSPSKVIDLEHNGVVWAVDNRSEQTGTTLVDNATVVDTHNSWSGGPLSDGDFGLIRLDGEVTPAWTAYVTAVAQRPAHATRRPGAAT